MHVADWFQFYFSLDVKGASFSNSSGDHDKHSYQSEIKINFIEKFSCECLITVKHSSQSQNTDNPRNQSKLEVNTCSWLVSVLFQLGRKRARVFLANREAEKPLTFRHSSENRSSSLKAAFTYRSVTALSLLYYGSCCYSFGAGGIIFWFFYCSL